MGKLGLFVWLVVVGWGSRALATPVQWTAASGGNDHWYDVVGGGTNGVSGGFLWDEAFFLGIGLVGLSARRRA